jgi:hypothetical protein
MIDETNELLDSSTGILLHEMISTIEDELREGSASINRHDSFKEYFEIIFERSIDEIDDIEEAIQNDPSKIDLYSIIRQEISSAYDNYFGITFDDLDNVDLNGLYSVYKVVYLKFANFLHMYSLGKCILLGITPKKMYEDAQESVIKGASIDIADTLVGEYIVNEDEFTSENIALSLDKADPGNVDYLYVFGEPVDPEEDYLGEQPKVFIDNNAFRRRVKKEYSVSAFKYLLELLFRAKAI